MSAIPLVRDQAIDTLVSFAFQNAADDAGYVRLLVALRTIGVTAEELDAADPSDEFHARAATISEPPRPVTEETRRG